MLDVGCFHSFQFSKVELFRNPLRDGFRLHQHDDTGKQREGFDDTGKDCHRQIIVAADGHIQQHFHHAQPINAAAMNRTSIKAPRSGASMVNQRLSGSGGLSAGSCGVAPTSPRYCVSRTNFRSAARASSPLAETATAGRSYFPSGNAKR